MTILFYGIGARQAVGSRQSLLKGQARWPGAHPWQPFLNTLAMAGSYGQGTFPGAQNEGVCDPVGVQICAQRIFYQRKWIFDYLLNTPTGIAILILPLPGTLQHAPPGTIALSNLVGMRDLGNRGAVVCYQGHTSQITGGCIAGYRHRCRADY